MSRRQRKDDSPTAPGTAPLAKRKSARRVANQRTAQLAISERMEELREAHSRSRLVLFVGSGISAGLGLPAWGTLVEHMAHELGVAPEEFRAKGSYLTLAEYFRIVHGSIGPLRSWMDRQWHRGDIDIARSRVHALLAKGRFPLIYTTNYDRWLECAFQHHGIPFTKIVSVADLARIQPGATQIIKFHGDLDDDATIVLDESSYFRRLEFESPLDIKLRADILGRSVVFLGYSLSDMNIRYLFYKLARLWRSSVPDASQPASYLVTPDANDVQQAVLAQWGIEILALNDDDPTGEMERFAGR